MKKREFKNSRKKKMEGTMIRLRCGYELLGENPTSYFLNMEKKKLCQQNYTKV